MIKCKRGDTCGQAVCCKECVEYQDCHEGKCFEDPNGCGDAEFIGTTEMIPFESNAITIMQNIANLDKQKKMIEAEDKNLRQQLQEAMDKYGIKKFENDILKITYVEPTTRTSIDSKKLKEELPAIAEKYTKVSQVKGSVRIEVK